MALHRDIYWVGRQWAVTGHGMQTVDQKLKGQFDIEASRLWDDGLLESVQSEKWLNTEDFKKALSAARKQFPSPSRKAAPPEENVSRREDSGPVEPPKPVIEPMVARKFEMRIERWPAKFVRPWRIRVRR
jgi:hypothetical protein